MTDIRHGDTNPGGRVSRTAQRRATSKSAEGSRPEPGADRRAARPHAVPRWIRLGVAIAAAVIVGIAALRLYTVGRYNGAIHSASDVPATETALVFGAGILPTGEPTAVLYDRVATAAELYALGKVERIVLSGDGRTAAHDEPEVMRQVAVSLGVPDGALHLDAGGVRTLESCRRAKEVFGAERAILVTQRFHLPRALMLCQAQGIQSTGVASDRRSYPWRWRLSWQVRETGATVAAWWDTRGPDLDRITP